MRTITYHAEKKNKQKKSRSQIVYEIFDTVFFRDAEISDKLHQEMIDLLNRKNTKKKKK